MENLLQDYHNNPGNGNQQYPGHEYISIDGDKDSGQELECFQIRAIVTHLTIRNPKEYALRGVCK